MSDIFTLERRFNLGDYRSVVIKVGPTSLTKEETERIMLENIFNVHKQFLLSKKIESELYSREDPQTDEWLVRLEELRLQYLPEEETEDDLCEDREDVQED